MLGVDYRQHLSQGKAIVEALGAGPFRPPIPSPWFGIFALLNLSVFLTMSVLIPWILSDKSLETPVVKSKSTDECVTAYKYESIVPLIRNLPQTDAVLQQYQN
ncbi:uncharacterized protein N7446_007944 [Penicillium canescens]|uniref:Uncharacterized protein n=1 Tax=Penicillium canescens TaxID=5083 RepID=A0AAD6IME5_PENCN|nr:uncharacterized protein N7446_007944 [Penicillium canescens]KAJ6033761.1 hypothetical protein N7444_011532 [Penicillium canescens]KAJ6057046.1 hypothetical protein N7460_000320 [Penicillium canescens]KAJ6058361.1 hypothetical protein N7446_007944 [Penicillium canescens]